MKNIFKRRDNAKTAFKLSEGATHVAQTKDIGRVAFTLAEVFSPLCAGRRKYAFTLAEVLITLGIIGVVAAITMPTLIQNYQKQVYVNQLKKTYSMLEQGFQKMLADEGVERLSDLPYWGEYYYTYGVVDPDGQQTKEFINILNKGFKVTYNKVPDYIIPRNFGNGEDGYSNHIQFADNSTIVVAFIRLATNTDAQCKLIKSLGGNMCSEAGDIYLDVNGVKGPNKLGRDIFLFRISDEGKLYPNGGKDSALFAYRADLASNAAYWKNNNVGDYYTCTGEGNGGCAARIIENGWKMDY